MAINYICKDAPSLKLRIQDDPDIEIQFVNGRISFDETTEEGQSRIELMDKILATRLNVSQLVKKSDLAEANRIAFQHKALRDKQSGIIKGGVNAGALTAMRNVAEIPNAREVMRAGGVPEDKIEGLVQALEQDAGIVLTEVQTPIERSVDALAQIKDDGFFPASPEQQAIQSQQLVEQTKTEGEKPKVVIKKA